MDASICVLMCCLLFVGLKRSCGSSETGAFLSIALSARQACALGDAVVCYHAKSTCVQRDDWGKRNRGGLREGERGAPHLEAKSRGQGRTAELSNTSISPSCATYS
jgi:hypothetical protein